MSSYTNPTARLLQNNILHSYPKSDIPRDSFFSTDSESSSQQVTPSASLGDLVGPQHLPGNIDHRSPSQGISLGRPISVDRVEDDQEFMDDGRASEDNTVTSSESESDHIAFDGDSTTHRVTEEGYRQGLHPNPHFQIQSHSHSSRQAHSNDVPISDHKHDSVQSDEYSEEHSQSIIHHDQDQDYDMSNQLQSAGVQQGSEAYDGRQAGTEEPMTGGEGDGNGGQARQEGNDGQQEDDDGSSINSIPDADIDFTLTYALHTFIATVDGQASVIKGDSLILLDDANSYWWLVRVLKTDTVGYIPAENIETPFERLARLNKHRNVDLATATAEENQAAFEREQAQGWRNNVNRIQLPQESPSGSSTSGGFVSSSVGHAGPNGHHQDGDREGGGEGGPILGRRKSVIFAQQLTREHPGRIIEDSEDETSQSGDEIDGQGEGSGLVESDRSQDDVRMDRSDTSDDEDFESGQAESDVSRVEEQTVRPSVASALAGGGAGTAAAVARAAGKGPNREQMQVNDMDPDDGMSWDESTGKEEAMRRQQVMAQDQGGGAGTTEQRQPNAVWQSQQGQQRDLGAADQSAAAFQQTTQAPVMQQTVSGPGRARSSSIGVAGRPGQATRPTVQIDTHVSGNRIGTAGLPGSGLRPSGSQTNLLDPVDALDAEPRRISATPAVAQANEIDRIMGLQAGSNRMTDQRVPAPASRKVSGASVQSQVSAASVASGRSSISPDSPTDEFGARKSRKDKSGRLSKRGQAGESETDDGSVKKKKGVFGGLFKKKEKREKGSAAGIEGGASLPRSNSFGNDSDSMGGRASDDESSMQSGMRDSPDRSVLPSASRSAALPLAQHSSTTSLATAASSTSPTIVSPHGLRLQQIDQQQQALYQQYMARSPTSAPEDASRAYGTQAAATVAQSSAAQRLAYATASAGGRPGSIMLTGNPLGPGGPLLNVMRIFAGQEVDSQSSFKTVLISEATIAQDLVKQAVQRFGLTGPGSVEALSEEYFLTVKGEEGEEFALEPNMKPLEALNEMAKLSGEEEQDYLQQVRRSSIGSISSVNSNLSMHPAISSKLNDFSDDSAVKLYLRRRGEVSSSFGSLGSELSNMDTLTPSMSDVSIMAEKGGLRLESSPGDPDARTLRPSPLAISGYSKAADRQPSPSAKFTIQVYIGAKDLPDTMCFDPQGDLPVYKSTVRKRNSVMPISPGANMKRKLLMVARNVTAGEAVEQGLEIFKIMDGVVDGGDDIEDRVGKRRSVVKVRYGLEVRQGLEDDHSASFLKASHAVLEAYQTPPKLRLNERTPPEARRRSREWSQSGASDKDIQPSDPVFILRRMSNRLSGGESVPLDDVALRKHKVQEEAERASLDLKAKQDMIAAQRAASRANQEALLSAHANDVRGLDVTVPNRGTLRSAKVASHGSESMRYSYIDDNGEAYDISSLVEEELDPGRSDLQRDHLTVPGELRRMDTGQSAYVTAPSTPMSMREGSTASLTLVQPSSGTLTRGDLLQGVVGRQDDPEASQRVQALLDKARGLAARGPQNGLITPMQSPRMMVPPASAFTATSSSPGAGSFGARAASPATSDRSDTTIPSRDATLSPILDIIPASIRQAVAEAPSRSSSRQAMTSSQVFGSRSVSQQSIRPSRHRHQPSITSILSQISEDGQRGGTVVSAKPTLDMVSASPPLPHVAIHEEIRPVRPIPKVPMKLNDEEDIKGMMASIQARAETLPLATVERPHINPLDRLLYGEKLDMSKLHPSVQDRWGSTAKEMEAIRLEIDALIAHVVEQQRRGNQI